ncbi:hypothetical protein RhiJN_25171 [Ceratobasidium sp. AG-Ba]|nr:hypothetical protein RhiJN_25171 [Ceratobasidium sp. AG-Ba]
MSYPTQRCEPPDLKTWTPESLEALISSTRFVFRVFDNRTEANYSKLEGFVADAVAFDDPIGDLPIDLFESVANHVDRLADPPSKWISATRRWDWAIWEMARRDRNAKNINPPPRSIRVAVIDLHAIPHNSGLKESPYGGRIIHALQLLNDPVRDWSSSRLPYWTRKQNTIFNLQNYSNSSDEVLFYERIPAAAIVSVASFRDIIPYVPGRDILISWPDGSQYFSTYPLLRMSYRNTHQKASDIVEDHLAFTLYLLRPVYNEILGLLQSALARFPSNSSELNMLTFIHRLLLDLSTTSQREVQLVALQSANYDALCGFNRAEDRLRRYSDGAGNDPRFITSSDVPDNFRSAWPLFASRAIEAQSRLNLLNQLLGQLTQAPASRTDNDSDGMNDHDEIGISASIQ